MHASTLRPAHRSNRVSRLVIRCVAALGALTALLVTNGVAGPAEAASSVTRSYERPLMPNTPGYTNTGKMPGGFGDVTVKVESPNDYIVTTGGGSNLGISDRDASAGQSVTAPLRDEVKNCLYNDGLPLPTGSIRDCDYTPRVTISWDRPQVNPIVMFAPVHAAFAGEDLSFNFSTYWNPSIVEIDGVQADTTRLHEIQRGDQTIHPDYRDGTFDYGGDQFPIAERNGNRPLGYWGTLQVSGLVSSVTIEARYFAMVTKQSVESPSAFKDSVILSNLGIQAWSPSADLSIRKSAPASVASGSDINWNIDVSVANLGLTRPFIDIDDQVTAGSHGFLIRDAVPESVENPRLVSAPTGCSLTGRDLSCSVSPEKWQILPAAATDVDVQLSGTDTTQVVPSVLEPGQTFHLEIAGTAPRTPGTKVVNRAQVLGSDIDTDLTNNTAEAVTTIEPPEWNVQKTTSIPAGTFVDPGQQVDYTVTATSVSGDVEDVVLSDNLSGVLNNASFVSGSAKLRVGSEAPIEVSDPIGTSLQTEPFMLPAGEQAKLTYSVRVNNDAWSVNLHNTVSGNGSSEPTSCAPNSAPQPECETDTPSSGRIAIEKRASAHAGGALLDGAAFRLLSDESGRPGAPLTNQLVTGTGDTGHFEATGVAPGHYWIEEVRAPNGHVLLANPVRFQIAANGQLSMDATPDGLVSIERNTLVVSDVATLVLPKAGGTSPGPFPCWQVALL
ncbi:DUF11 domain-containing protein [Leucobacter coleopterorum]|uniref:DUF11 domain-containing protein n=1 Tax=Leucobacter coleopterorum TaxID=2714933 RepID=A0ABX6JV92_9MICO|nr:prealbumin-like fold domain-containing protein [Leucobacter coleopterorum]QIM18182.1 DUF11 domain-containing protein [Leucobacter coleopterorum]